MSNVKHRLGVAWARFRANLHREPYGVKYKNVVYFNRAAIKALREADHPRDVKVVADAADEAWRNAVRKVNEDLERYLDEVYGDEDAPR